MDQASYSGRRQPGPHAGDETRARRALRLFTTPGRRESLGVRAPQRYRPKDRPVRPVRSAVPGRIDATWLPPRPGEQGPRGGFRLSCPSAADARQLRSYRTAPPRSYSSGGRSYRTGNAGRRRPPYKLSDYFFRTFSRGVTRSSRYPPGCCRNKIGKSRRIGTAGPGGRQGCLSIGPWDRPSRGMGAGRSRRLPKWRGRYLAGGDRRRDSDRLRGSARETPAGFCPLARRQRRGARAAAKTGGGQDEARGRGDPGRRRKGRGGPAGGRGRGVGAMQSGGASGIDDPGPTAMPADSRRAARRRDSNHSEIPRVGSGTKGRKP